MRTVVYRPLALKDALEQAVYIAEDSRVSSHRFLDAFESVCHLLQTSPYAGAAYIPLAVSLTGMRHIHIPGFPNHLVFYRVFDAEVEIVRVLHSARDMDTIALEDE